MGLLDSILGAALNQGGGQSQGKGAAFRGGAWTWCIHRRKGREDATLPERRCVGEPGA